MTNSSIKNLLSEKFGEKSVKASQAKWREGGGKIVGWTCTYVPEELIAAAGALPIRIFGEATSNVSAERYMNTILCPLVKNIMSSAVEKKYDIDGLIVAHTCDQMPKLQSLWDYFLPLQMNILMAVPKTTNDHGVAYMLHEMNMVKEKLEELTGEAITDNSLREAVATFNKTRDLLRKLSELRKLEEPKINGREALMVMKAAMSMPKGDFNNALEEVLPELEASGGHSDFESRIAVAGGYLDRSYLAEAIEGGDAIVVVEDLCTGHRYFGKDDDVRLSGNSDLMLALAQRYLNHEPCSCMYGASSQKFENTRRLIEEYKAEAVVWHSLKFCDSSHHDGLLQEEEYRKRGVPILHLETDYSDASLGQIGTRVEAFLETLEEEDFYS